MIAFSIWNINVYWYGILYFVWFVFVYLFLKLIWKKKIFSKFEKLQKILDSWLEDLLIYLVLWVLLWGRLGEVFIYQWDYFSNHLSEIFAVWNWWMAFVWGLIWVIIALIIFARVKKIPLNEFFILGSLLVLLAPFTIMLWRFWNYLNQELYGIVISEEFLSKYGALSAFLSNINIFHVYNFVDNNLRLNTNFLAIIFEWLIPFVVWICLFFKQIKSKIIKPYLNIWVFVVLYSFARFVLEYFRVWSQSQIVWWLSKSQRIFLLFFVVWVVFFVYGIRKKEDL